MTAKNKKVLSAIMVLFFWSLYCFRAGLFGDYLLPADVLISLLLSAAVVFFCVIDSRVLGINFLHSLRWLMFFTWPLSVPIYFLYTRGPKGILTILGYSSILIASAVIACSAGYLLSLT